MQKKKEADAGQWNFGDRIKFSYLQAFLYLKSGMIMLTCITDVNHHRPISNKLMLLKNYACLCSIPLGGRSTIRIIISFTVINIVM